MTDVAKGFYQCSTKLLKARNSRFKKLQHKQQEDYLKRQKKTIKNLSSEIKTAKKEKPNRFYRAL